jgi:hypothetical protein
MQLTKKAARILVHVGVKLNFNGGLTLESCLSQIGLGFYVFPFLQELDVFND